VTKSRGIGKGGVRPGAGRKKGTKDSVVRARSIPISDEDMEKQVHSHLYKMSQEGNAFAAKTLLQAKGRFVERSEIKVGLTADELTRRLFQARRELRDAGYNIIGEGGDRVVEMQRESGVFPEPVRLSSGQEHSADGEVGAVAVSHEVTGGISAIQ